MHLRLSMTKPYIGMANVPSRRGQSRGAQPPCRCRKGLCNHRCGFGNVSQTWRRAEWPAGSKGMDKTAGFGKYRGGEPGGTTETMMATGSLRGVLRTLLRVAVPPDVPADPELLDAFVCRRDEAAFEALVRRHGPMVWGVCRRILRNEADAEDAFQATFLVFVRKAASIARRAALGNWLYGVAHNTALKARVMGNQRR